MKAPSSEVDLAIQDFNELFALKREVDAKLEAAHVRLRHLFDQDHSKLLADALREPPRLAAQATEPDDEEVDGGDTEDDAMVLVLAPSVAPVVAVSAPVAPVVTVTAPQHPPGSRRLSARDATNHPESNRNRALAALAKEPMTSTDASKALGWTNRYTIHDALKGLRAKGYVEQKGKGAKYFVTEEGQKELARVLTGHRVTNGTPAPASTGQQTLLA